MSDSAPPHRFAALDAWRGIAAVLVAFRHINGTAWFLDTALHDNLSSAVDFFFVLSGFVIAMRYGEELARGFSLLRFMVLRWGRVWPLHAVMVLIYLVLELVLLALHGAGMTGRAPFTGPRDPLALPVSLFLLQAWVWPDRDLWNTQSWSISVELGLYLGAALLWRVAGLKANWIGAGLGLAVLVLSPALLSVSDGLSRGIAGFGLGMGCWALWPAVRNRRVPDWLATVLELALPVGVAAALVADIQLWLVDPLFAVLVLVYAREQGLISRALRTAPAQWLGTLSYAVYMVHGLVIGRVMDALAFVQGRVGAQWVSAHLGGQDRLLLTPWPTLAVVLGALACTLAAAWLAWCMVEWPARTLSRRWAARIGPAANPAT